MTGIRTHGERARTSWITAARPASEGPVRTVSRAAGRASSCMVTSSLYPRDGSAAGELSKERLALLVAQTAQTAAVGDLELLHDLGSPDLADTRHRLQDGRDLELADDVVRLGPVEHGGEGGLALLELLLQLGTGFADLRCLFQRCRALFGAQ